MVGIWSVDWRLVRRWEEGRREGEKKVWAIKNGQARKKNRSWGIGGAPDTWGIHWGRHLPCSNLGAGQPGLSDQRAPPNWKTSSEYPAEYFPVPFCSFRIPELIRVTLWYYTTARLALLGAEGSFGIQASCLVQQSKSEQHLFRDTVCTASIAQVSSLDNVPLPNRSGRPMLLGAGCQVADIDVTALLFADPA
jgi:hypothetical protein